MSRASGNPRPVAVPAAADRRELTRVLAQVGLAPPRPVVVLVGGADGLTGRHLASCDAYFRDALVPALEEYGACLLDGGTDFGVMALAARARREAGARMPHIGVVAAGTVRLPGQSFDAADGRADLEPHHDAVLVVPGEAWGDESPWISTIADVLAGAAPSVTVLANGGAIARRDVQHSLDAGRTVIALAGTGRAADDLAADWSAKTADARKRVVTGPPALRKALTAVLQHARQHDFGPEPGRPGR